MKTDVDRNSAGPACSPRFDQHSSEWHDAMVYAFETAADGMDLEEFGGDEPEGCDGMQDAAYREVARRIRKMKDRYNRKYLG